MSSIRLSNVVTVIALLWTGLLALPVSSAAQDTVNPTSFIGFWEFPEPAGDKAVVIIKAGGRVSCFWSGSSTRAIIQGRWEADEKGIVATWESGHIDQFIKLGENAMERLSYSPGANLQEEPVARVRGVRVDNRLPGSLAVQMSPEERGDRPVLDTNAAPMPLRNSYIGFWKIPQSSGFLGIGTSEPHFYLRIGRNGRSSVALRDWNGDNAFRGSWEMDGDRLIIHWPDQHKDVIVRDGKAFSFLSYRPKDDFSGRANETRPASMVSAIEAERYFAAGEFKRLTVSDIRGKWVPVEPSGRVEHVQILGWGNAIRSPSTNRERSTDQGKWRLQSDRVIISWQDGSSDIMRVDFPRMMLESFGPGEPVTGMPRRSIEITKSAAE